MHIHIHVHHESDEVKVLLTEILETTKEIKRMDQATLDLLKKIDDTTNHLASNIQTVADTTATIATTDQTISDELDALIAAETASGNTPPDVLAAFQAAADKLQSNSDLADTAVTALQAQVPVLQGIAAKGAPVVPPAPGQPTA